MSMQFNVAAHREAYAIAIIQSDPRRNLQQVRARHREQPCCGQHPMIDLPFVASRVFGTPLMTARGKLEVILGALGPPLAGTGPWASRTILFRSRQLISDRRRRHRGDAVIDTLVTRSGSLSAASGLSSYGTIGNAIASAFDDPAVRGIVLEIDSPGGEVGGLFDLVQTIASLEAGNDKPLLTVASESALSAAYAIASAADRIYVTQTGEVGSIGVVAIHVDESSADAKAGLVVRVCRRPEDGNAHQPLSDQARGVIQNDVDRLYEQFVIRFWEGERCRSRIRRSCEYA